MGFLSVCVLLVSPWTPSVLRTVPRASFCVMANPHPLPRTLGKLKWHQLHHGDWEFSNFYYSKYLGLLFPISGFCFFSNRSSCSPASYTTKDNFELLILLALPHQRWDYSMDHQDLFYDMLGIEPRASWMLSKNFTNKISSLDWAWFAFWQGLMDLELLVLPSFYSTLKKIKKIFLRMAYLPKTYKAKL